MQISATLDLFGGRAPSCENITIQHDPDAKTASPAREVIHTATGSGDARLVVANEALVFEPEEVVGWRRAEGPVLRVKLQLD